MGPRRRRSSSWRAAPAVGHSRRETKPCPHASSGREGPVRIPANEGDGTDELLGNVGFQRHSRAQLSANSNAPMESFWGSLKNELIHHHRYATRADAKAAIQEYIESFYNRQRRHSRLGYVPPALFAEAFSKQQQAA
jgi:hypothetical protein